MRRPDVSIRAPTTRFGAEGGVSLAAGARLLATEFSPMESVRSAGLAFGLALIASAAPAHAAVQTVGGFNFSTSGNTVNQTDISITPFTAGLPSSLTAVKIYFKSTLPTFGGNAGLLSDGDPYSYTNTGALTFTFTNGVGQLTTTASSVTLTPSSTPLGTFFALSTASGNFAGSAIGGLTAAGNPTLQAYFSGAPKVDSYFTSYTSSSAPSGAAVNNNGKNTGSNQYGPTTLGGQFYIQYEYTAPSAATPGPIPLLGAGAAFAYSRRIRGRIKATV